MHFTTLSQKNSNDDGRGHPKSDSANATVRITDPHEHTDKYSRDRSLKYETSDTPKEREGEPANSRSGERQDSLPQIAVMPSIS